MTLGRSRDWKQRHADESCKALEHPLVVEVMKEFADNMGFKLEGLPRYGLKKVAMYAAQVARAQALGIDPDDLRSTPEEAEAQMLRKARLFVKAGKPVMRVDDDGITRLD